MKLTINGDGPTKRRQLCNVACLSKSCASKTPLMEGSLYESIIKTTVVHDNGKQPNRFINLEGLVYREHRVATVFLRKKT